MQCTDCPIFVSSIPFFLLITICQTLSPPVFSSSGIFLVSLLSSYVVSQVLFQDHCDGSITGLGCEVKYTFRSAQQTHLDLQGIHTNAKALEYRECVGVLCLSVQWLHQREVSSDSSSRHREYIRIAVQ